jgi:hypothetical protein
MAQGVVILGVAVLLGEEEDMDEMRAGTASTVAKFSGQGWPEARAISRRRSCHGDGFGLRSPCSIANAIKRPTMSARCTGKRGGQWNQRGGERRPVLTGIDVESLQMCGTLMSNCAAWLRFREGKRGRKKRRVRGFIGRSRCPIQCQEIDGIKRS